MKDFKSARKPGGFGGRDSFRGNGGDRGGFGRPQRGGFGDRGGRNSERPTMYPAVCSECGNDCEVPFRPNGNKPVLCSTCFSQQKGGNDRPSFSHRDRDFSAPERTMFKATCQECGAPCEVPFQPTAGKPIFCSDCFRGNDKPAFNKNKSADSHNSQLDALNAKLDQILSLLKPADRKTEKDSKIVEEIKKTKMSENIVVPKETGKTKKAVKEPVIVKEVKKPKKVIKVKAVKMKKAKVNKR